MPTIYVERDKNYESDWGKHVVLLEKQWILEGDGEWFPMHVGYLEVDVSEDWLVDYKKFLEDSEEVFKREQSFRSFFESKINDDKEKERVLSEKEFRKRQQKIAEERNKQRKMRAEANKMKEPMARKEDKPNVYV